jgi:hypothetical protein
LGQEAIACSYAGFFGGVRLCVLTGRIGLNSAVTDDIEPAVKARHDRYDVDGTHVVVQEQCRRELHHTALAPSWR